MATKKKTKATKKTAKRSNPSSDALIVMSFRAPREELVALKTIARLANKKTGTRRKTAGQPIAAAVRAAVAAFVANKSQAVRFMNQLVVSG